MADLRMQAGTGGFTVAVGEGYGNNRGHLSGYGKLFGGLGWEAESVVAAGMFLGDGGYG